MGGRHPQAHVSYAPNTLNQYSVVNGVAAGHDLSGNLTSWTLPGGASSYAYTYDSASRLRTATRTGVGANGASYDYDPLGRRVSKLVGGVPTLYLLDGAEEIAEYAYIAGSWRPDEAAALAADIGGWHHPGAGC